MEMMDDVVENSRQIFSRETVDFDVVVSSRVRLARNLIDYPFPGKMDDEARGKVRQQVVYAFRNLDVEESFLILDPEKLEPLNMKRLFEKNVSGEGDSLIVNTDGTIIGTINEENHLSLACISNGLDLKRSHRRVDRVDTGLEKWLDFACSLEWGYHCTSVTDMGTGLKASVTLHLPGLMIAGVMDDVKNSFLHSDFLMEGVFREGEAVLGDLYQISNHVAFGRNEEDTIKALIKLIDPILRLERKSRSDLLEAGKEQMEDRIFRAYGILKYCRSISFKEAMTHLSYLRMGVSMGIIDEVSIKDITALFFLLQDSHITRIADRLNLVEKGQDFLNMTRSKMIRDLLSKEDV